MAQPVRPSFLFQESPEEKAEFATLADQILARCKTAEIKASKRNSGIKDSDSVYIEMPTGKQTRTVFVFGVHSAKNLLSFPFEDYQLMPTYNGIVHRTTGAVEVQLSLRNFDLRTATKLLFGEEPAELPAEDIDDALLAASTPKREPEPVRFVHKGKNGDVLCEIGPPSAELKHFTTMWGQRFSLKIRPLNLDDSLETNVERIADALLFEIDLNLGLMLAIEKYRGVPARPGRRPKTVKSARELVFPKMQYDLRPMSLYRYARTARGMPLLQFFAFYQVLEFFFPVFSEKEAIGRMRTLLKDPRFNHNRDHDMLRLLGAIASGRSFNPERHQLKATIRACVDGAELREFFCESEDRKQFFQGPCKQIAKQRMPLNDANADLIDPVCERIYEIRCKIVHTKGEMDENEQPLLPFSTEAELLGHDIQLVEFLAIKALIVSSTELAL
jgi:hypothetical protein